jgi:hypothetical protein
MIAIDNPGGHDAIFCVNSTWFAQYMQMKKDDDSEINSAPCLVLDAFRPGRGELKDEEVVLLFPDELRTLLFGMGVINGVLKGTEHDDMLAHIRQALFRIFAEKYEENLDEMNQKLMESALEAHIAEQVRKMADEEKIRESKDQPHE